MSDYIGRQFGNYQIVRKLAGGSFGTVYLAEHLHLEMLAAIKILHMSTELDAQARDKFLHEARVNARLQHPHIIRIIDFGFDGPMPYMVMDYAPNGNMRTLHPRGTCVSAEHIVSYVNQIASALNYAHEQHVIHRDIKPENILLNSKWELVLSDFGIAVVMPTLGTLPPQSPAGTPLYMAPEQIQGKPCAASDQYALGVMVYEWLCGEPPFHGPSMAAFAQHLYNPPPSLSARLPHLPPAVEDTVLGALAKDPQHRFSSVQDFARILEEAFYVTQQLSLDDSVERGTQNEIMYPIPRVRPAQTLTPSEPDLSNNELAQSRHKAIRHPEERHAPVSIMCVCAPPDQVYLDQWETHLRLLEQAGYLTVWSERHLLAGAPRMQQIYEHLKQADLLILLLSADFFASEDCNMLMNQALLRHQRGEARAIPLLLRPVAWQESPLASLSCIPSNYRPVVEWRHLDAAFDACIQEIRRIIGRPVTSPVRPSQASVSTVQHRNRRQLLKRVRSVWITGVLNHSLHGAALMALGLEEQPDAVANPWHLVLQPLDTAPYPLPTGIHITQVYDDAEGELLILGAPGSGKTTLLLELARVLLNRAEVDEHYPVPVVLNLSSWALKPQPLTDWLAEELNTKYQVPHKLGQALVNADLILPLLDGLDEVAPKYRTACIETINTYRQEHGLLPLVICSRSSDYLAQTTRILLRTAVVIQPLTTQQIDAYLYSTGTSLSGLRQVLQIDAELQELARTPLMLSILTLTYQGTGSEEITTFGDSLPNKQRQVLTTYVQRMLQRRSTAKDYTSKQTMHWLSWLTRQMKQRNQTVFYMERMQPDWLEEQQSFQHYPHIVVGIIFGLLGFFGLGPLGGLILVRFFPNNNAVLHFGTFLCLALFSGLVGGLIFGLVNGLLYRQDREKGRASKARERWRQVRRRIGRSVQNGLLIGLLIGCPYGLFLGQKTTDVLSWILSVGIFMGIFGGIVSGLIDALLGVDTRRIQPAEAFSWSWANMGRNLVKFLFFGLLSCLLIGLFLGLFTWATGDHRHLFDDLLGGLQFARVLVPFFALLGGLLGGLAGGWSNDILDERDIAIPNQGIRRSARYSLLIALVAVFVVGMATVLMQVFLGIIDPWSFGFVVGPLIGLVGGLRAGGMAFIEHMILRWLLWKDKAMPWNYSRFLDYAAEHILLRKVGGGYIFVHRLLLDYFASLEVEFVAQTGTDQRQGEGMSLATSPAVEPLVQDIPSDSPMVPGSFASIATLSLLPCGHEMRPNARFCSICGSPVMDQSE